MIKSIKNIKKGKKRPIFHSRRSERDNFIFLRVVYLHRCAYANSPSPDLNLNIFGTGLGGRTPRHSAGFQKEHRQNLFGALRVTVGQINQNLILKIFSHIRIGLIFFLFLFPSGRTGRGSTSAGRTVFIIFVLTE